MGEALTLSWMVQGLLARTHDHDALTLARHALLDTCSCIIAGQNSEQVAKLDASLVASGETGFASTALRLGVAAHARDFDDYEEPASTHPSAVLVPVLLTLTLHRDGLTMRDFLAAYTRGYEAIISLGKALGYGHYLAGWYSTSTLGRPGAAMAAASLLGLEANRAAVAVSLAMTQSAGLKAQFGTDAKALHAGLAARTGVEAGLLVQAAFTASTDAADGAYGFAGLFGTTSSPGCDALRKNGLPAITSHPPFVKPSPSCGYTIRPIEAAMTIAAREHFDVDAVADNCVKMSGPYFRVAGFPDPANAHEARFSTTYCLAVALADGGVGVAAFEPGALNRADVRRLVSRIRVEPYELPTGLGDMGPQAPDTVTVTLARGGPGRLMTAHDFVAKYEACGGSDRTATALLNAPLDQPFAIATLIETA